MTGTLTVTLPSAREVRTSRTFDAPRAFVWDAHTRPDLVKRWLTGPPGWTMTVCEIDLKVGGRYRYVWAHPEQQGFGMVGEFKEIVAPERIVHSERFDGSPGGEAIVTVLFTETAGKTTLTLTMIFESEKVRDEAVATGMTDGMEMGYQKLDALAAGAR